MKRSFKVDIVGGTVNHIGHGFFDVVTTDMYVYRIAKDDKRLYSLNPELGDVVWLYRAKQAHRVTDILFYDENPRLGDEPIEYDLEIDIE